MEKIMKTRTLYILLAALLAVPGWSAPTELNYHGTLREKTGPVTGTRTMVFRITNDQGTTVYWSSGNKDVQVVNGYFSERLNPTGVDWANVIPYVEVSVNGKLLSPREPISANAYAFVSNESKTVANNAITVEKLDPKLRDSILPAGAILMFDGACPPSGWESFDKLNDRFPLGPGTGDKTGGSRTHSHTIAKQDLPHQHKTPNFTSGGLTYFQGGRFGVYGSVPEIGNLDIMVKTNDGPHSASNPDAALTSNPTSSLAHDHGGSTGVADTLPPFYRVVFCRKL
jgi:hypothetical protein